MSSRDATPILDAVRRQRGEFHPYGKQAADIWAPAFPGHSTPDQTKEAARILAGTTLTLGDDK